MDISSIQGIIKRFENNIVEFQQALFKSVEKEHELAGKILVILSPDTVQKDWKECDQLLTEARKEKDIQAQVQDNIRKLQRKLSHYQKLLEDAQKHL